MGRGGAGRAAAGRGKRVAAATAPPPPAPTATPAPTKPAVIAAPPAAPRPPRIPRTGVVPLRRIEKAFAAAPGARNNFVKLSELRKSLPGTREQQDAAIMRIVRKGRYRLEVHEGLAGSIDPSSAIRIGKDAFYYIERRNR